MAADREAPHKQSVGLGALCPFVQLARLLVTLDLDPVYHQLDPSLLPSHGHLGGRESTSGWGLSGPPHFPSPGPLPCATDQPVNAGGSGHGTGAQGLLSERQSVGDSEREPGRGCRLPGAQRRPRVLGGCEGGPAARVGTCNSSGGVSLGGPSTPPHTWPSLTSPQEEPGRLQTPDNWTGDPQIGRRLLWS